MQRWIIKDSIRQKFILLFSKLECKNSAFGLKSIQSNKRFRTNEINWKHFRWIEKREKEKTTTKWDRNSLEWFVLFPFYFLRSFTSAFINLNSNICIYCYAHTQPTYSREKQGKKAAHTNVSNEVIGTRTMHMKQCKIWNEYGAHTEKNKK